MNWQVLAACVVVAAAVYALGVWIEREQNRRRARRERETFARLHRTAMVEGHGFVRYDCSSREVELIDGAALYVRGEIEKASARRLQS